MEEECPGGIPRNKTKEKSNRQQGQFWRIAVIDRKNSLHAGAICEKKEGQTGYSGTKKKRRNGMPPSKTKYIRNEITTSISNFRRG